MTPSRDPRRAPPAQAVSEFALVVVVFLLLVMGTVDFGRGVLYYNMLDNAAREGARTGVISTHTVEDICQSVVDHLQVPGLGTTACDTIASDTPWNDGNDVLTLTVHRGTPGSTTDPVGVTVSYLFTPITPLIDQAIGIATGGSIQIGGSSTMYVEGTTMLPSPTPGPTDTPQPTATPPPTATPLPTSTPTATPLPTSTPTATPKPTMTPTLTPMPTVTPTCTPGGHRRC